MDSVDTVVVKDSLDIARLMSCYRAIASERADGHIHDPYARLLAGERGEEVRKAMNGTMIDMWAITVRTKVYDDIIMHLVKRANVDTIISLAAGLDTRPYRLPLPQSVRWIEYDRPEVLAYKQEKLARIKAACLVEQYPLDLIDDEARQAALEQATQHATRALVLTEGLLIYLPYTTVVSLAKELREQPSIRWWLTEVSPNKVFLEPRSVAWNKMVSKDAQVHFTPANGIEFFSSCNWEIEEFRYLFREFLRLRLPFKVSLSTKLMVYLLPKKPLPTFNSGGFALLKPTGSEDDAPVITTKKKAASRTSRVIQSILHWFGLW
jgi:methyltransferase (TIGR00027 family)